MAGGDRKFDFDLFVCFALSKSGGHLQDNEAQWMIVDNEPRDLDFVLHGL
jgi:hypothetical protein